MTTNHIDQLAQCWENADAGLLRVIANNIARTDPYQAEDHHARK